MEFISLAFRFFFLAVSGVFLLFVQDSLRKSSTFFHFFVRFVRFVVKESLVGAMLPPVLPGRLVTT